MRHWSRWWAAILWAAPAGPAVAQAPPAPADPALAAARARLEARAAPVCLPAGDARMRGSRDDRAKLRLADPSRINIAGTDSRKVRHHALDCLAAPLAGPLDVAVECIGGQAFGRFSDCIAVDPSIRPDLAQAAAYLAADYGAGVADRARVRDDEFRVRFSVRLDPADRLETRRDPTTPLLQITDVNWAVSPRAIPWDRYYPDRALRQALQADLAILCRITEDHSLLCPEAAVEPADSEMFLRLVSRLEARARARPELADASASAGRWVAVHLRFRLPE